MSDCIFCKMIDKSIPVQAIYEDEYVLAFNDIRPVAPVHALIIPKKHIDNICDITDEDDKYINAMTRAVRCIARSSAVDSAGFRIVINTRDDGGQTVHHLHWHVIGGRRMKWPPG